MEVVAATGHSIWADVSWPPRRRPGRASMYQLVRNDDSGRRRPDSRWTPERRTNKTDAETSPPSSGPPGEAASSVVIL